jgi:hypothetical protein
MPPRPPSSAYLPPMTAPLSSLFAFRSHILKIHPDSPAKTILSSQPPVTLLHHCEADISTSLPPLQPNEQKLSLQARVQRWQLTRMGEGGTLCRRMLPRCRPRSRPKSWTVRPDPTITIQNRQLRELAIRWRLGTFGYSRPCPDCNNRFFPIHILHTNSSLVPPPPLPLSQLDADIQGDPLWRSVPYTIIDSALNNSDWSYFLAFVHKFFSHYTDYPQMDALLSISPNERA